MGGGYVPQWAFRPTEWEGAGTSSCKWQWVSLSYLHGPLLPHFFFFLQFNSGSKQLVWPKAYLFFVYRCFMNHKRCENLKFIDRIFERSLHLLFFRDRDLVHCLRICQFWGKITHKMRLKFHNWTIQMTPHPTENVKMNGENVITSILPNVMFFTKV